MKLYKRRIKETLIKNIDSLEVCISLKGSAFFLKHRKLL